MKAMFSVSKHGPESDHKLSKKVTSQQRPQTDPYVRALNPQNEKKRAARLQKGSKRDSPFSHKSTSGACFGAKVDHRTPNGSKMVSPGRPMCWNCLKRSENSFKKSIFYQNKQSLQSQKLANTILYLSKLMIPKPIKPTNVEKQQRK